MKPFRRFPRIAGAASISAKPIPARREALIYTHFPPKDESVELLNTFRSPAQTRLIFEEFFYYQLALALRRRAVARRVS